MYTLTYTYSRPQIRRFFLRELWRNQGGFLMALPFLIVVVVWASTDQDFWWYAGFLAGMAVCYILVIYSSYRRTREFPVDHPVTTTVSEAGLHFQHAFGVSEIPWSAIRATRRTRDGLLLSSRVRPGPVLLPSTALTEEIVTFIEGNVKQGGTTPNDGA